LPFCGYKWRETCILPLDKAHFVMRSLTTEDLKAKISPKFLPVVWKLAFIVFRKFGKTLVADGVLREFLIVSARCKSFFEERVPSCGTRACLRDVLMQGVKDARQRIWESLSNDVLSKRENVHAMVQEIIRMRKSEGRDDLVPKYLMSILFGAEVSGFCWATIAYSAFGPKLKKSKFEMCTDKTFIFGYCNHYRTAEKLKSASFNIPKVSINLLLKTFSVQGQQDESGNAGIIYYCNVPRVLVSS